MLTWTLATVSAYVNFVEMNALLIMVVSYRQRQAKR